MEWNTDINPSPIFDKFNKIANLKDGKIISFTGMNFEELTGLLNEFIELDSTITYDDCKDIISRAITNCKPDGEINKKNISRELSKAEKAFLKSPYKKYIYITRTTLKNCNLKSYKFNNCNITFKKYLPPKFLKNRNKIVESTYLHHRSHNLLDQEILNSMYVVVSCSAKSITEAFLLSQNSIDTLFGLWNLYLNLRKGMRSSSSFRVINDICLGPIFTIHNTNGTIATRDYWDIPLYRKKPWFDINRANFNYNKIWSKYLPIIKKHNYNDDIVKSVTSSKTGGMNS